jgi:hypothetical protein
MIADVDFVLLGNDNLSRETRQPLAYMALSQCRLLGHIDR